MIDTDRPSKKNPRLRGSNEPFTVRPEKICLVPAGGTPDPACGEVRVAGTIRASLYLGERTRYTVDLDAGGQLVAVEQNRTTSATEAGTRQGHPVRLAWDRRFDQLLPVDQPIPVDAQPSQP